MSPRRRHAKLTAQVSDDFVLVTPCSRAAWHVRKRALQGSRITRQQPHPLKKIIHGVAAYLILLAFASGCAHVESFEERSDRADTERCGFPKCWMYQVNPDRLDQYNREMDHAEREHFDRSLNGGGILLCFNGKETTLCVQ